MAESHCPGGDVGEIRISVGDFVGDFMVPDDRAGNELGEEGHIERKVDQAPQALGPAVAMSMVYDML